MTRTELREAVASLPITQAHIPEQIGVSHGHLRNCLSGTQSLSKPALMLLARLMEEQE